MHRWSPLNERQHALLHRLAAGEDSGDWEPGEWRSAYALRDRGLLAIRRGEDGTHPQVTDAGTFYLRNGYHPEHPVHGEIAAADATGEKPSTGRTPYSERPIARARRAKVTELVERLVAEGRVIVEDPGEDEVTEWRRVINYAKRHGLEPQGKRIERTSYGRGGFEMYLATGPHVNSRGQAPSDAPQVQVPARLRSPHPVVMTLRDEKRLTMPSALRLRTLRLLQGLAGEAVRRGYEVNDSPARSWRAGEVNVIVASFTCTVTIQQEFPQSENPERSGKLVIELPYSRSGRQRRWGDRKRWVVEDALGAVLEEIEARAVEDAQHKVEEERAKVDREVRWKAAMMEAREQVAQAQFAQALREQTGDWHEAMLLRAYCDALERRLMSVEEADSADTEETSRWLDWARRYVQTLDPLSWLPVMSSRREPTPDDLKPYLKGWSPYGPESRRFGWDPHQEHR
ncbi:hypothetical protein OG288_12205 [Streptomyces tauricus]|uniref:PE-PGRS family protein n=1 Tax=Streptomyces tauricus TaxID=68274 RepID=A0ABZ1JC66_9ACTN|nr:hypothetical protein [Streptomyces tauricus]MCW8095822.1 hypothetical protein [Streptomyces tauricus]